MTEAGGARMIPDSGAPAAPAAVGPVEAPPATDPATILMSWLIPFILVGYPLAGSTTVFLSFLHPTTITYGYRGVVVGLAAIAMAGALFRNRTPVLPFALTFFLLAYLIRLVVDNYLVAVYRADLALLFYAGAVLPPILAVLFAGRPLREEQLIVPMFVMALAASSLLLVIRLLGIESEIFTTEQTGGRLTLDAVNPITIGHVGATLLIACAAAWYQPRRLIPKVLIAVAAAIALATMLQAASRGPFVSVGACLILYAVVTRRWSAAFLALAAVVVVISRASPDQLLILDRFSSTGWDPASEARLITQDYAIADFFEHPVLGHAYIEQATLDYPHNLILDAAMALGLVGLIPLGVVLFQLAREIVGRLKAGHLLMALLAVQFFVAAMFSGSIWGHSNLFSVIALLLVWSHARRAATARAKPAPRGTPTTG